MAVGIDRLLRDAALNVWLWTCGGGWAATVAVIPPKGIERRSFASAGEDAVFYGASAESRLRAVPSVVCASRPIGARHIVAEHSHHVRQGYGAVIAGSDWK